MRSEPDETARPMVHFTAPVGWLNDPNGLVSVDGEHHLFFQHNPNDTTFGAMHWGHAVSGDFVTWRHLPGALAPDEHGIVYSGSAVIDRRDTAGFGRGAVVAVFTYHTEQSEAQALAWSLDAGRTFTKFSGNPVLPPDPDRPMCRDPKVFRFGDDIDGHWVMVLAAGDELWIHTSEDLRAWERRDVVAAFDPAGALPKVPGLFKLRADDGASHWVWRGGCRVGAPAGGSGTAYIVGAFDGARFTAATAPRWVDHGRHFYAAQTWNDLDERLVWIAWMGNWSDGAESLVPAPWRGQLTLPRELALEADGDGYRLVQAPVHELERFRRAGVVERAITVGPGGWRGSVDGRALDVVLTGVEQATAATIDIACTRAGREIVVSVRSDVLTVAIGSSVRRIELPSRRTMRHVRIVLDVTSIEVWCGCGAVSEALEGEDAPWRVELRAGEGDVRIDEVAIHRLESLSAT
ncbi:MAG: glycoside hydrolase family 32 protein [Ilumatobacteraceae bacterium]